MRLRRATPTIHASLELRSVGMPRAATCDAGARPPYVIGGDAFRDVVVDDLPAVTARARRARSGGAMLDEPLRRRPRHRQRLPPLRGDRAPGRRLAGPRQRRVPGADCIACWRDAVVAWRAGGTGDLRAARGLHDPDDSPLVSREHARLEKSGDQWIIADRGSTNGTFVNGQRLSKPHALKAGDRIDIATSVPVHRRGGTPARRRRRRPVRVGGRSVVQGGQGPDDRRATPLLHDISFVIEPGEFVAIFGTQRSGNRRCWTR